MKCQVKVDEITKDISNQFDYEFNGEIEFKEHDFQLPKDFSIGLIVGNSGSGKSTIIKSIGGENKPIWDNSKAICSHFESAKEAADKFSASGLGSVPDWVKPYNILSNGEKFRADMARMIKDGARIDEFTSVVDRDVAKSCSVSLSRYIKKNNIKNVVIASCHRDIEVWLQPDWVFDCDLGMFIERRSERRPEIKIELLPCSSKAWTLFSKHHYLDGNINKSSRCWVAFWEEKPVGFASTIAYPSGTVKNAWREHRTVVLPEFQGLGIGVRISDAVGHIMTTSGYRYFSKTSHPRMGEYREKSNEWKPTSKNRKARKDYSVDRKTKEDGHKMKHVNRVCYSHEYIGGK